jgi:hypothetical protein
MRGGPLSLFGVVVCLTNVGIVAYGLIGSGIECNTPSMVFRVGGIGINVMLTMARRPTQCSSPHWASIRPATPPLRSRPNSSPGPPPHLAPRPRSSNPGELSVGRRVK